MKSRVKNFFCSTRGLNTVEVVIILAVVLGIALIFRNEIRDFVNRIIASIFDTGINWGLESPSASPGPT